MKTYKSKGKLLITGEYTVLDGALALAVPTKLGQSLHIQEAEENKISWFAYKHNGELWFNCVIDVEQEKIQKTNNVPFADTLLNIFLQVKKLNPAFFPKHQGYICETQLEFPEDWGLGSSSTLINNIAKWTNTNPYQLLKNTFGGSGYDIACAQAQDAITYQLIGENTPEIKEAHISSQISEKLIFIHLNQKQNSREGIEHYRKKEKSPELITSISEITQKVINPNCTFNEFSELMIQHETLISHFIEMETVKNRLFSDYPGFIKSLGAWGGDFIMVEKLPEIENYFKNKGYLTIKTYEEFLL